MTEDEEANDFLADVAGRLVELAIASEDGVKYIAYTLGAVLDILANVREDDPDYEFASALLMNILRTMTYVRVVKIATDATGDVDIEREAQKFADLLEQTETIRKNKSNEEDTTNGNGND